VLPAEGRAFRVSRRHFIPRARRAAPEARAAKLAHIRAADHHGGNRSAVHGDVRAELLALRRMMDWIGWMDLLRE
jgi:hypothetical protein